REIAARIVFGLDLVALHFIHVEADRAADRHEYEAHQNRRYPASGLSRHLVGHERREEVRGQISGQTQDQRPQQPPGAVEPIVAAPRLADGVALPATLELRGLQILDVSLLAARDAARLRKHDRPHGIEISLIRRPGLDFKSKEFLGYDPGILLRELVPKHRI